MESKQLEKNTSQLLGIFIFYQEPDVKYWSAIQSFLHFSLGLKYRDMFKYSISDYNEELGYLDIMSLILDDISNRGNVKYHNILVYVENSMLLSTDYHKDVVWYRLFDIYQVEYIVFIYKEYLVFDKVLFPFKVSCTNENLKIEEANIDSILINKMIVLDNLNIEEFCHSIWECTYNTKLIDFMVERYSLDEEITELYTNFIPTNDIKLFLNYKYSMRNRIIDKCTIIPIYVSILGTKLLDKLYRELKKCQKAQLINRLLI